MLQLSKLLAHLVGSLCSNPLDLTHEVCLKLLVLLVQGLDLAVQLPIEHAVLLQICTGGGMHINQMHQLRCQAFHAHVGTPYKCTQPLCRLGRQLSQHVCRNLACSLCSGQRGFQPTHALLVQSGTLELLLLSGHLLYKVCLHLLCPFQLRLLRLTLCLHLPQVRHERPVSTHKLMVAQRHPGIGGLQVLGVHAVGLPLVPELFLFRLSQGNALGCGVKGGVHLLDLLSEFPVLVPGLIQLCHLDNKVCAQQTVSARLISKLTLQL
mmetsp:Transcript_1545/g.3770  ORF Transcript_1545/g.3770 Transcript_1545/m.3770 type:complete len:266 (+) Transcript_1545:528-1325(+)